MSTKKRPRPQVSVDRRVGASRSPIHGNGLFALANLEEGTVVIRLGGRLVSSTKLDALIETSTAYVDTITVYEDAHLVLPPRTLAHFGNHSCDPTLWHVGPYELATRRAVTAGEELTIDYATQSGAAGFALHCRCRSSICRAEITAEDWRLPELQERYAGHWTPALQARISGA